MNASHRFCTFDLGNLWFGVEVAAVQEVMRALPLARVPLAAPEIAGLLNLRGQILTAIDLRKRMGLPPQEAESRAMQVVVRARSETFCLEVDKVGAVVEAPPELYEPPPAMLSAEARGCLMGVYKLPQRLLHVLALEAVTHGENNGVVTTPLK